MRKRFLTAALAMLLTAAAAEPLWRFDTHG